MESNRNWSDIGNEIRGAVEDSLRTGDFTRIGGVVSDTVNQVVNEAKRQVNQSMKGTSSGGAAWQKTSYQKTAYNWNGKQKSMQTPPVFYQTNRNAASGQQARAYHGFAAPRAVFQRKGNVSGVLLTVFGGIGTGIMGVVALIVIILFLVGAIELSARSIVVLLLLFGCIGMITAGVSSRKLLQRAERYLFLCRGKSYVNIADLAKQTQKSENFVRRDVRRMMAKGIFPQGHLDMQESCLMISDDTYREYLAIEKQRKDVELDEFAKERQNAYAAGAAADVASQGNQSRDVFADAEAMRWRKQSGIEDPSEEIRKNHPELAKMIWQGQECTGHIREMNEKIPGEVISQKLFTLENVLKEIFKRVREHPEQMGKMQKFMDYYLPTTLKLVEAYEEFDQIASPNAEIIEAKAELEKTLDTINQSFEELRNQLFSDAVFDVTTDAKVLQTMLAKDGLAKDHAFDLNKK